MFTQLAGAVEYTDCTSPGGVLPPPECPGYDTKQSDGEVPVMLELWGMWSTPSECDTEQSNGEAPVILLPLWPRMVAPDRALSMG